MIHFRIFDRIGGARSLCHSERLIMGERSTTSPNQDRVTCPRCLKLLSVDEVKP